MITGEDNVRQFIPGFDPFMGWDQVRDLRLRYGSSDGAGVVPPLDCAIACSYPTTKGNFVVTMELTAVQELRLPDRLGSQFWQISELVITDDPKNPPPGGRFWVEDETLSDFGCFCSSMSFTRVEQARNGTRAVLWEAQQAACTVRG